MIKKAYPFAAIVGLERTKQALMLLAVDPRLSGLLIASPPGTGKTILTRSFEQILSESFDQPAPCSGSPRGPKRGSAAESGLGRDGQTSNVPAFIEVPIGVTEDMLLGGVDLESALAQGRRAVTKGLLARANGGFICVDHINLLNSTTLRHLLAALDSGVVVLEREGISSRHQARFGLLGTMDAWDTETAETLKERVGLIVDQHEALTEVERCDLVDRVERFTKSPEGFCGKTCAAAEDVRRQIRRARSRLRSVKMERSLISRISSTALDFGIRSSRADLFAVRAARASAALRGCEVVEETDLMTAVDYVLLPRARDHAEQQSLNDRPTASEREGPCEQRAPSEPNAESEPDGLGEMDEVILPPVDFPVPSELEESRPTLKVTQKRLSTGSGRRREQAGSGHGRYVGVMARLSRPRQDRRIAIDATLRAAAPHQRQRRAILKSRLAEMNNAATSEQAGSTTKSAKHEGNRGSVIVKSQDLKFKRLKHRTGVLFVFLVDTSGSMALGRIGHAKGVMIRMLRHAYLHRDRVALLAFRGRSVEVALEPTSSVELARRAIESLPAGGGTPLGAGLAGAIALAERARKKATGEVMLLVFTDGRVNVALNSGGVASRDERAALILGELEEMGARLRRHGIRAVVIDTGSWDNNGGRCRSVSEAIGARYCRLPGPGPDGLYAEIRNLTAGWRAT